MSEFEVNWQKNECKWLLLRGDGLYRMAERVEKINFSAGFISPIKFGEITIEIIYSHKLIIQNWFLIQIE